MLSNRAKRTLLRKHYRDDLTDDAWFNLTKRPFRVRPWRPGDNDDEAVRAERAGQRGWYTAVFANGVMSPIRGRLNPREICGIENETPVGRHDLEILMAHVLVKNPSLGIRP